MEKRSYHISEIGKISNGQVFIQNEQSLVINDLLIDSRKLISTHQNLFIALKTKRNDGHNYIEELIRKGVTNFIVSTLPDKYTSLSANFVLVSDGMEALQVISAFHRKQFNIPIIGITGSNGKTIIKEWLYQCLNQNFKICRSPRSYNSQIGVPLSLFQLQKSDQLGIFEAGISEIDEMLKLEKIIKPTIGIFTNIGEAHHEHFVDMRQKVNEKLMLFVKSDVLIFCRDYDEISDRIYSLSFFKEKQLVDWSRKNKAATLFIDEIKQDNNQSKISAIYKSEKIDIQIPFIDEASVENSIHVLVCMLHLKIPIADIKSRLANLAPIAMRMELKEGINNCTIINDSYNSDFNAFSIAINFLLQQQQHVKKTIILSDILQSGKSDDELYRQVSDIILQKNINRFIGIGPGLKNNKKLFQEGSLFYESTQDFLDFFPFSSLSNETILLKGARNFEFEKINSAIGKKTHQTRLEVNLSAMLENFNYFRSITKADVKIMIMVKAFSYGSGSFEVANLLQFNRADYLAVAYADEGIDLRKAGITMPIMVMNTQVESLDAIISNQLEPEIYSFQILQDLEKLLNSESYPENKPIGIHIKIDTGMHRLGFDIEDTNQLIQRLNNNPKLIIKSVFSHLATSDDAGFDDFTRKQLAHFELESNKIIKEFDYPIIRHIANSAAISRFPEAQYGMVRLGISLYGIATDPNIQKQLKVVSTLKTIITQIKSIKKGESVGYSRAFIAAHDMRIATIPIGYADGFDRRFSQGKGKLLIKNKLVPIIGNVCMDMCMVDLEDLQIEQGDEVIVFGENPNIQTLAEQINTIPYELLTSVSSRVKRIYLQE